MRLQEWQLAAFLQTDVSRLCEYGMLGLQVAIQNVEEVLETAKRKFGEAGRPVLENALEQSDLDISPKSI